MKEIPLTKGKFALVDDEMYDYLMQWRWYVTSMKHLHYAMSKIDGSTAYMHRVVTNAPKGMEVDHINGNGLNNTKDNLRICTHAQNRANSKYIGGTSQYKGVYQQDDKWVVTISVNDKTIYIGQSDSERDAALIYDGAARAYYGEYARLNFPDITTTAFEDLQQRQASTKSKPQEMRRRILAGDSPEQIAAEFGVLVQSVRSIRSRLRRRGF